MLKEFKEFALKGNVLDLAVGIIIGTAFTAIVTSLVDDILMPPLGVLLGGVDFSGYYLQLTDRAHDYPSLQAARTAGAAVVAFGSFAGTKASSTFANAGEKSGGLQFDFSFCAVWPSSASALMRLKLVGLGSPAMNSE